MNNILIVFIFFFFTFVFGFWELFIFIRERDPMFLPFGGIPLLFMICILLLFIQVLSYFGVVESLY